MASVNKAILIGNIGAIENRTTPNGDAICSIRLATTESWKDKTTGEKKEITEWHRVVLYRKLGEIAGQYLKKGAQVYIEGRIKTRKWTDKEGQERYTTEIEAIDMTMLGAKPGNGAAASAPSAPAGASTGGGGVGNARAPARDPLDMDDEIPFVWNDMSMRANSVRRSRRI